MTTLRIERATVSDLDDLAKLFDDYRQFYGQKEQLESAREFLSQRLTAEESAIFLAVASGSSAGFTQLYPSYSSVAMKRVWILNDLYVASEHRRCGIAKALLQTAEQFARDCSAARLVLATAVENTPAKLLYETNGWRKDTNFDHYQLQLS